MAFCSVSVIWSRRNPGNHGCSWSSMRCMRRIGVRLARSMRQGGRARQMDWCGMQDAQPGLAVPLIHDGASQVMGPVGGVVVGPDAGVDLGDDDLGVWGAELVDFFCEQGG